MVVGDQPNTTARFKLYLSEYVVTEANSGRVALKKVLESKPDVIMVDALMPGIDGFTVLSIIRKTPETRFIPVILYSAIAGVDDQEKALEKGADEFITTPFNPEQLQAKVKALITIKSLRDQLTDVQGLLISLSQTVENKTEYFVGHGLRTANFAVLLARKDFLQPVWMEEIRTAALLHDIGMINVPEALLVKKEKLTEAEYAILRNHPVASEKICSVLTMLKPVLPYLRSHHERFDGSGYPDRLAGHEIPLGARILAVADAFDALTCERPSRKAFSVPEALGILQQGAGSHWDPELVELFCQLIQDSAPKEGL
jgi:putative two-component system response regulator